MALLYTTSALKAMPSAAAGVSVTPSAVANWVNSSWVEVEDSTTTAWVIAGIAFETPNVGFGGSQGEIDIGVGAGGSEVVIATICMAYQGDTSGYQFLPIPVDVASGSRVAVRMRKNDTNAGPSDIWKIALNYYEGPMAGEVENTSTVLKVTPTAASPLTLVGGGGSFANGTWAEVTASTSAAWTLAGIYPFIGTDQFEIDIGVGSAGNEVVVTTFRAAQADFSTHQPLWHAPLLAGAIGTGVRVAARVRLNGAGNGAVKVLYYESLTSSARTSAHAQETVPANSVGTTVASHGTTVWASGSWTEFVSSTANALAITGMHTSAHSGEDNEVDVGIGSAGNETVVTTFRRWRGASSSQRIYIPLPIAAPIASGQRVSVRMRSSAFNNMTVVLTYADGTTFDQKSAYPQSAWPPAADAVSVTPSGTAYNNSSWSEIVAATSQHALITGVSIKCGAAANDVEIDLGTGAAGSESVVTTLRLCGVNTSGANYVPLPVPHYVVGNTRVAVRMRKAGTSTTAWTFALTYLSASDVLSEVDFDDLAQQSGEVIGLSWVELSHVDTSGTDKTYLWAPVDLTDPSTYYGGFKEARVLGFGDITRGLSDRLGQYEAAEWSWLQSDTDRLLRGLLDNQTTKFLLNRMALIRMIDDASRRALLKPRVLVRGIVRHYQPKGPLQFEFVARDFVASLFGPANLEKQIPQRTISRADFPDCPTEAIGKPVPIIYGNLSYTGSAQPPPTLTGTESLGAMIDLGVQRFGFAPSSSAAAVPTNIVLTNGSGPPNLTTDVQDRKYGVIATAVDSSNVESDPSPYYTDIPLDGTRGTFNSDVDTNTVDGTQTIIVNFTTSSGAAKYRVYLMDYYKGAHASQYFELTHPTATCTFNQSPPWRYDPAYANDITSGASRTTWSRKRYYRVSFVYADGDTVLSPHGWWTWDGGFRRTARVQWETPGVTPLAVKIYAHEQGGPDGGREQIDPTAKFTRLWTTTGSAVHFDDDWLDTNVTYIEDAPQPTGAVPVVYVGSVEDVNGDPWSRFLICGHAVKEIESLYVDGMKIADSEFGVTVACPGKTGYSTFFANTGSPQYMDINGRRYTCVMVRGRFGESMASGTRTLTANVKGIETVGDGSGTLITSITDIYKHAVINWLFQSYQSGSWLSAPEWPEDVDGTITSQVDEASFDAVETIHAARLSGGYPGAIMFGANGESVTLRDALARLNLSADCQCGFNRNSQFFITAFDHRQTAVTGARHYSQVHDILATRFDLDPQTDEVENIVVYNFKRRYSDTENPWDGLEREARDQDAINDLREERRSPVIELHGVRSEAVASDIAHRRLAVNKEPPLRVDITTNLKGLATEIGDVITVTHTDGVGASGWTERPLRVMRHVTNPGQYTVTLECVDVNRLYESSVRNLAWMGGNASTDPLDGWTGLGRTSHAPEESIAFVAQ